MIHNSDWDTFPPPQPHYRDSRQKPPMIRIGVAIAAFVPMVVTDVGVDGARAGFSNHRWRC